MTTSTTPATTYLTGLQQADTTRSFSAIISHNVAEFRANGAIADFQSLASGTAIIATNKQAVAYLAAYGHMHQMKLVSAFEQLTRLGKWPSAQAEVIDWGCGQGLASGVLIDYLSRHNAGLTVSRFTLIEPSAFALNWATDHLHWLLPNQEAVVRKLHASADAMANEWLRTDPAKVKVHLFSNLLDMESVKLSAIAQTIRATQRGLNLFVCVSPTIHAGRNGRLRTFRDAFVGPQTLSERSSALQGQVFRMYSGTFAEQAVQRNECIFSVQL